MRVVRGESYETILASCFVRFKDGRVSAVTNAASAVLQYERDSAGRVTDISDPLASVTRTDFDSYGNASDVTYGYGSGIDRPGIATTISPGR